MSVGLCLIHKSFLSITYAYVYPRSWENSHPFQTMLAGIHCFILRYIFYPPDCPDIAIRFFEQSGSVGLRYARWNRFLN